MSNSIKISISVVFYNSQFDDVNRTFKNFTKLCSLKEYDFQFFAIDNGSQNNCFEYIKKLSKDFENVTSIKLNENNGFGSGHNSVLNDLNSSYHIVMNPDIIIEDVTGFKMAIDYLQQHSNVVLLSPLVKNMDGSIQYLNRHKHTLFDLLIRFIGPNFFKKRQDWFVKKENGYGSIQQDENATGCFMLLRTNVFKSIGGFDTRYFLYFEDADLTYRLEQEGKTIFFPMLNVKHEWQRKNHTLQGIKYELISLYLFFSKWGWKLY